MVGGGVRGGGVFGPAGWLLHGDVQCCERNDTDDEGRVEDDEERVYAVVRRELQSL